MIARALRDFAAVFCVIGLATAAVADDISIVGSSTVYPFMRIVTKEFMAQSGTEVTLEATGTGTGFDYFCAGIDEFLPDINNASTPMTRDDYRNCRRNGVREIVALTIGFDGLVAFQSDSKAFNGLTKNDLYRALANEVLEDGRFRPNSYRNWNDINPALPAKPIQIIGPPPSSGTRHYIENFVLGEPCLAILGKMSDLQRDIVRRRCERIRTDGAYVDVGEDDAFLIESVLASNVAVGLVGYGQYLTHQQRLRAIPLDNVLPTFENISSGRYELSRPLFVYVKGRSLERKDQITNLLSLFFQPQIADKLKRTGFIPLPEDRRLESLGRLQNRTALECPSRYCTENERR
jgi:phosphate transport system substrate-binding protein